MRNKNRISYPKSLFFFFKALPYIICFIFFIAFAILSVVRHNHYQSYGYDLGINDQVVWEYSQFHAPITTIDHVVGISKLDVHIESIYIFLAPFYWIWNSPLMLLLLQAAIFCFSGMAVYLLAKHYKLHSWIQIALLLSYLLFYGVQDALWFDVQSAPFEAAFTMWFIYFLITQKNKWATVFFLLAITGKENVAGMTFLISGVYFLVARKKTGIYFALASLAYLAVVFGIYFPHFVQGGYRFANQDGLFSNLDPRLLFNTNDKLQVYFYTLFSYGFLAVLNPLYLIPVLGNLASYFILGSSVPTAQGLFGWYRVELDPLMSWATVETIVKIKRLNTKFIAVYLIICVLVVQYVLHLPLSYLTKQWFWAEPSGVKDINLVLQNYLPPTASVVTQDNILPHIAHRNQIYTLYPEKKTFTYNSPCGQKVCDWFRWDGDPEYLFVDTSPEWDARDYLTNRNEFINGLHNLEKDDVIQVYKRIGNTTLYKVNIDPDSVLFDILHNKIDMEGGD